MNCVKAYIAGCMGDDALTGCALHAKLSWTKGDDIIGDDDVDD